MKVIPFEEKYRKDFIEFNTDWIVSKFNLLEQSDIDTFEKIDEEMSAGAMIFFAVENDTALATCMARPMKGSEWELCKLASNSKLPHPGAGSAVFEASMKWALSHGAEKLFLISNSSLKPALHIYKKYGFTEVELKSELYARGDIAFEYNKAKNKKANQSTIPERRFMKMKAVVKKEDSIKKVFKGVSLDSLAVGKDSQVTKMNYAAGDYASAHQHPNEQSGYVISGRYQLTIGEDKYELNAGDSYSIPKNQIHSFRVVEPGQVIDVFVPPRADYL